jgi:2-polyprenyl-3-methyl-5-hydroxy-6-metoxy-1,4-benzoquinol methylase
MAKKMDTANEGLDLYVHAIRTFADTPWLHYGLWEAGERVVLPNLRRAQERYVEKLLGLIPPPPCRLLEVGGGTGEMSRLLADRGHSVEMITPSAIQCKIARERLGSDAVVHQTKFEDFAGSGPYDVVLFSESFQYVPLDKSLPLVKALLAPGGALVISDVFRSEAFNGGLQPGGGHRFSEFVKAATALGFAFTADEDSGDLRRRRPFVHWLASGAYRLFVRKAEREKMQQRLKADYRSPERFAAVNTYRFVRLTLTN